MGGCVGPWAGLEILSIYKYEYLQLCGTFGGVVVKALRY
jgi:hypothetical protein